MTHRRRYVWPREAARKPIDALIVGHLTRDLLPDGGWRPGGAALYAAVTASRLGLRVGVVTSAPADLCASVSATLEGALMIVVDCETATTFENIYTPAGRVQYLRARAEPLTLEDIPMRWRRCEVALLAPVAGEVEPGLAAMLEARVIGAAPQGWLRRWEQDGRVRPPRISGDYIAALRRIAAMTNHSSQIRSNFLDVWRHLSALILSREDLTGPAADTAAQETADQTLRAWARLVPLIAVTRGADGADLYRAGAIERFPGAPAHEVDPTGAGDVFAAAFLCALARDGDAAGAIAQANRIAALSVEGVGPLAIPTLAQVAARYPER